MAYQDATITDRQRELIDLRIVDELAGDKLMSEEDARAAGAENAEALYRAYSSYRRGDFLSPETSAMLEAYAENRREQLATPMQISMLEADYLTRKNILDGRAHEAEERRGLGGRVADLLPQMMNLDGDSSWNADIQERNEFDSRVTAQRDTRRINNMIDVGGDQHPHPGPIPGGSGGGPRQL